MILEIRLANFYSFKDEVVLNLRAGSTRTKKSQSVLADNVFKFEDQELLKSVAIYGANASGKSNLIKAIRFCVNMVLGSHTHNEDAVFNFQPFKFKDGPKKPSTFTILFVHADVEYEYGFSLSRTEIEKEWLYHYPNGRKAKVFTRDETYGKIKSDHYDFGNYLKRPMDVAENTSRKTLFLSRASQMDRELPKELFRFFNERFLLGFKDLNNPVLEQVLTNDKRIILDFLRLADSDIVDYKLTKQNARIKKVHADLITSSASIVEEDQDLLFLQTFHTADPKVPFDFATEESDGTRAFLPMVLNLLDVISQNKILLLDEIEVHLHTKLVNFIIDLFHQSSSAQLIYTTHNTNLLDLNRVRKDQVYFVNKKEQGVTDLYSLFDYKDFRDTMDVEKAYLQGRFDAIPILKDSKSSLKNLIHGAQQKGI